MHDRGLANKRKGDFAGALEDVRAGLALKLKALGPDHPDIGTSWGTIAEIYADMGDDRSALDAADRFLESHRKAYGGDSPFIAHPLGNRGEILARLGRHAEAQRDLRASIDRWTAWVGPDHPWIAYPLTALGKSLIGVGRPREAIPLLEQALRNRDRDRAEPNRLLAAETRFALACARWDAGADRDDARALAIAARDAYRPVPAQAKRTRDIDAWLAAHPRDPRQPKG